MARRAGVGLGTVSRVLNGSPQVRDETRARVLTAIEELDYRPNPLARGLSLGRSHTLGVVVPFFTHPSAVARLQGVVAALDGSRYDLVLFNVASPAHRDEHFAALTRRDRADGLLVMSLPAPAHDLERLVTSRVPVVLVDAYGPGVPCVVTDDVSGGRLATEHLVALGHRRIGFIGDDPENPFGFVASAARQDGCEAVLAEHGLELDPELVRHGPHDREIAEQLATELLSLPEPPTAIFASSDVQALGALAAATAQGRSVPADLSVVGFDDIELSSYARLTTVRQPLFDSGFLGASLLLEALEGATPPPPVVHELPVELVERATTGPNVTTEQGSGRRG
ncbi:MAG TPA: LacI family DNA-binding transcriptional regulator [Acidimicrobiales bacterium]